MARRGDSLMGVNVEVATMREKFDAIILPDLEKEVIATGTGKFKTQDGAMRYSPELPPEYAGGLEKEGMQALETFVKVVSSQ